MKLLIRAWKLHPNPQVVSGTFEGQKCVPREKEETVRRLGKMAGANSKVFEGLLDFPQMRNSKIVEVEWFMPRICWESCEANGYHDVHCHV